jgi:hypothetical protein
LYFFIALYISFYLFNWRYLRFESFWLLFILLVKIFKCICIFMLFVVGLVLKNMQCCTLFNLSFSNFCLWNSSLFYHFICLVWVIWFIWFLLFCNHFSNVWRIWWVCALQKFVEIISVILLLLYFFILFK